MESFITCTLAFLEMTFIFVALLILHSLRNLIGKASFFMAMGLLFVFAQFVSATELKVVLGYSGADFYISPTVIMLPYLTALMIVYIVEGTLETQRLIIGAIATLGFYVYLSYVTSIQCNWIGYSISQGPTTDSLDYLLSQTKRTMAGSSLAQILDLFLIPIFFQRLRNLKCRMLIAVTGALMLTQLVDSFIFVSASYWGDAQWWLHLNTSYIAKSASTIWLSFLATIYITRIENEIPGEGRGTLDIIFAFLGSYGKAQTLQQRILEWEGRYRMVIQNASDMILLLDEDGIILDANFAAAKIFRIRKGETLLGKSFPKMIFSAKDKKNIQWEKFSRNFHVEDTTFGRHIDRLQCIAKSFTEEEIELDIAITSFEGMKGIIMYIVLGRDVTEENRLAREREELSIQLAHTQRLDSLGQLAGGVAHDVNNYIHVIQGRLDLIKYTCEVDEEVEKNLSIIDDVTEKIAGLTQKLLGFARRGKYEEKNINLQELITKTIDLFMPDSQNINFDVDIPESPAFIKGDTVQLQQVFLNLMINARDAMEEKKISDMRISVKLCSAEFCEQTLLPPVEIKEFKPADYFCISIKDRGTGIDKEYISKIFDPFFTTKPYGKGTGMGLAMAYGIISHHNGWIQVNSTKGIGTVVYVFLPKAA